MLARNVTFTPRGQKAGLWVDLAPSRVSTQAGKESKQYAGNATTIECTHAYILCGLLCRLPPIDPSASGDSDICHNKPYRRHRFHSLSVAHTDRREASHDDNRRRYATAVSWSEVRRGRRRRAALPPEKAGTTTINITMTTSRRIRTWCTSREE